MSEKGHSVVKSCLDKNTRLVPNDKTLKNDIFFLHIKVSKNSIVVVGHSRPIREHHGSGKASKLPTIVFLESL